MADLKQRFGRNVAAQRKRLGWTQDRLAAEAHVSVDMVKRLEAGRVGASFTLVDKLQAVFGVDASVLFRSAEPSNHQQAQALVDDIALMGSGQLEWLRRLLDVIRERPRS